MGQAKQRGNFEQRRESAINRSTLEEGVRNSTQWVCAVCGARDYIEVFTIRRISPLYTPGNVEAFFKDNQTTSFRCLNCSAPAGRRQGEPETLQNSITPMESWSSAGEDDRNPDPTNGESRGSGEDDYNLLDRNTNER